MMIYQAALYQKRAEIIQTANLNQYTDRSERENIHSKSMPYFILNIGNIENIEKLGYCLVKKTK